MTVERRFQAGFEEEPTDEPGLVLDESGAVWAVAPGGARTEVGASDGGPGLPSEWSFGAGGALSVQLDSSVKALDVRGDGSLTAPLFFFSMDADETTYDFSMSNDGTLFLNCHVPGSGQVFNIVDDDNGQVILSSTDGVQIIPSGSPYNSVYVEGVSSQIGPTVQVFAPADKAGAILLLRVGSRDVLRVDVDGSLHGKTGKSLVFDL